MAGYIGGRTSDRNYSIARSFRLCSTCSGDSADILLLNDITSAVAFLGEVRVCINSCLIGNINDLDPHVAKKSRHSRFRSSLEVSVYNDNAYYTRVRRFLGVIMFRLCGSPVTIQVIKPERAPRVFASEASL